METNSQFHGRPSLTPSSASRCWHLAQLIPRLQPHGRRHSAEHTHHTRSPDTCCHRPSAPFGILSSSSANIVACALDAHRCSSSRNEGFRTSSACRAAHHIWIDLPAQRDATDRAAGGGEALEVGAGTRAPSTASGLWAYSRSPQDRIMSDVSTHVNYDCMLVDYPLCGYRVHLTAAVRARTSRIRYLFKRS